MNLATTTEKIQRFFGLDGASTYQESEYHTQPQAQPQTNQKRIAQTNTANSQQAPTARSFFRSEKTNADEYQAGANTVTHQSRAIPNSFENSATNPGGKKIVAMEKPTTNRESMLTTKPPAVRAKSEEQVKKISILEPRTYTEAKSIAQAVFRNEVVIINFHLVGEAQARRIVDFLTGAVYALDGDIQRLDGEMFICTPPNMEVDSAVAKSLLRTQFSDF